MGVYLSPDKARSPTIAIAAALAQLAPREPMSDNAAGEEPLRSIHTSTFPELLCALLVPSVLVTTYQAGQLVMLRADAGLLNTHFRMFPKPMGMALRTDRLAIGTEMEICEFHNVPAVCGRLDPPAKHDACFLPRTAHATGDIAYPRDGLGGRRAVVRQHAVLLPLHAQPRVQLRAALAAEVRFATGAGRPLPPQRPGRSCEGAPKYVTALGTCDEPGGWRQNKRDGGVLIDVASHEVVARGLSMPHSPRWYRDRLWLLQSGTGGLGTVDLETGKYESVVEFPGFTRGLDFLGPLAFVGLSQVRDSAVFSGIEIASRAERYCGVWIVNVETGQIVGFVQFEDAVQEIFAVQVLPQTRFPDLINDDKELLASSYVVPNEALRDVPQQLRGEQKIEIKGGVFLNRPKVVREVVEIFDPFGTPNPTLNLGAFAVFSGLKRISDPRPPLSRSETNSIRSFPTQNRRRRTPLNAINGH